MGAYHFNIVTGDKPATETLEARDDASVIREALLLMSEMVRDHALDGGGALALVLSVRDAAGRTVWRGTFRGEPQGGPDNPPPCGISG